jgi:hypothetical protein
METAFGYLPARETLRPGPGAVKEARRGSAESGGAVRRADAGAPPFRQRVLVVDFARHGPVGVRRDLARGLLPWPVSGNRLSLS